MPEITFRQAKAFADQISKQKTARESVRARDEYDQLSVLWSC